MSGCGTVNCKLDPWAWFRAGTSKAPSSISESRFRGSFCRKPNSLATISMLLKYWCCVSAWVVCGCCARVMCARGLVVLGTYLDCLDLQLQCGIFVDDDHWMWVGLEAGQSPHVVHTAFDAALQSQCFVCAGDNDDDLARLRSR